MFTAKSNKTEIPVEFKYCNNTYSSLGAVWDGLVHMQRTHSKFYAFIPQYALKKLDLDEAMLQKQKQAFTGKVGLDRSANLKPCASTELKGFRLNHRKNRDAIKYKTHVGDLELYLEQVGTDAAGHVFFAVTLATRHDRNNHNRVIYESNERNHLLHDTTDHIDGPIKGRAIS